MSSLIPVLLHRCRAGHRPPALLFLLEFLEVVMMGWCIFVVHLKPYLNSHENSPMSSAVKSRERSRVRIPVAGGSDLKGSLAGKLHCKKSH